MEFDNIADASEAVAKKRVSPVELVSSMLDRINRLDPTVHAYLRTCPEQALAAAREAETEIMRGAWRGPLHGIPYAVKDNYFTRGIVTSAASRVLEHHVPEIDATAVARLGAAGAVLLGKLNTWEYGTGFGRVVDDLPHPAARNPWNTAHFTGGSSSGAGAAVAAGLACFALGSDTGGSIRLPAAACGLQGLKPTYGRVSRHGILPNCWSLDVAGPLCWTVRDAATVLGCIAGHDPADDTSSMLPVDDYATGLEGGVAGLRVGLIRDMRAEFPGPDEANLAALERAAGMLTAAGARIVSIEMPAPLSDYRDPASVINWSECATVHAGDLAAHGDRLGISLREKLLAGSLVRAVDYLAALRRRRELAALTAALFDDVDVLLLPGAFHTAPLFSDSRAVSAFTSESAMAPFNISGHPAMTLRAGFDPSGMPANIQLATPWFAEAILLRVARVVEAGFAREDGPCARPNIDEAPM